MTEERIPPATLPLAARAPGKCILFGEHAIVHGKPELVIAIDLHTQVIIRGAPATRLNGDPEAIRSNPYFRTALEKAWSAGPPVDVRAVSRIPRAAGLGSSAAFVAATAAGFTASAGGGERSDLAQLAFTIERTAQGVGSPGDTAAAVAGGCITLNAEAGRLLWSVQDEQRSWTVRRLEDPGWIWVVAYSGVPRDTAETVRSVGRRLAQPDGPELLERFATVALDGIRAVVKEDRTDVGELMKRNQELLREVGVSHPRLEAMLDAVGPVSLGAKLTGAGAGGSLVVLPHPGREMEAARKIARVGGVAYVVRVATEGAALVPEGAPASTASGG